MIPFKFYRNGLVASTQHAQRVTQIGFGVRPDEGKFRFNTSQRFVELEAVAASLTARFNK